MLIPVKCLSTPSWVKFTMPETLERQRGCPRSPARHYPSHAADLAPAHLIMLDEYADAEEEIAYEMGNWTERVHEFLWTNDPG
ncbi:hypothetical protein [Xanthomonas phage JGB6]|nr:hypothetical protein [Xanthomonas phage JGB6]